MNKLAWIAGMLALGAQNGSMPGVRGASPTSAPVIVAAGHVAFVEQEGLNFTPNGKVFFGLTDGAHWLCGTFTTADDLGFVSNTQYNCCPDACDATAVGIDSSTGQTSNGVPVHVDPLQDVPSAAGLGADPDACR